MLRPASWAMTNNDFEADNNWMQETAAVFAQNSSVAVVYCSVVRRLDDPRPVFLPGYASSRLA
ncbi:MAG TPA: hypothetical protein VFP91_04170 [Vicinamibacterales bacterium]|nr:hypothetical protein [Vicinamibacterales bacterium]